MEAWREIKEETGFTGADRRNKEETAGIRSILCF
jgi:hypothetical protein